MRVPRIPRFKPNPAMDEVERILHPSEEERKAFVKKIRDELADEGNRIDARVRRKR